MKEGREGGWWGEGEVGEGRRKNVRFMELGKLKVIKSEDYSTAKLLKFLREVEGFRPVLNSKSLGGQQYTLFTIYFYPFSSFLFALFSIPPNLSSPFFHQAHRQYRAPPKFLFKGASAPPIPTLSLSLPPRQRRVDRGEVGRKKRKSQREGQIQQQREEGDKDALTQRMGLLSCVSVLTPRTVWGDAHFYQGRSSLPTFSKREREGEVTVKAARSDIFTLELNSVRWTSPTPTCLPRLRSL